MQDLEPMFPASAPSEIPTDLLPESAAPAAEPEAEAPERTSETDLSDAGPKAPDCPPGARSAGHGNRGGYPLPQQQ